MLDKNIKFISPKHIILNCLARERSIIWFVNFYVKLSLGSKFIPDYKKKITMNIYNSLSLIFSYD